MAKVLIVPNGIIFTHTSKQPWRTIGIFLKLAGEVPERISWMKKHSPKYRYTRQHLYEARKFGEKIARAVSSLLLVLGWLFTNTDKYMKKIILFSIILVIAGCLKFGENIDLKGNEIKDKTIKSIEKISKIKFPNDSIHLRFSYFGDTIDPYWHYKGELTKNGYKELIQDNEFTSLNDIDNNNFIQSETDNWWNPQMMDFGVRKKKDFPDSSQLTYSIGKEKNKFVVYISYHTL